MKKFIVGTVLSMAMVPAMSYAGFLNNLEGYYSIGGANCQFDSSTKLTGRAAINSIQSEGITVRIEAIIGGLTTEIPLSFRNGSGDVKNTEMEGDIIPLPVTRRIVWETDESARKSAVVKYEGVGFAKKTGAFMLSEASDGKVMIKVQTSKSVVTECVLVKK
jgi:hypothetical protein